MVASIRSIVIAAAVLVAAVPVPTAAQAPEDKWQFQAIVYAYLPDLGGKTAFPGGGSSSINVNIDQILSNLNFTFMGTFEARKGQWGMFTDLIYLDVNGSKDGTRNFAVGDHDIPANAAANLDLGIKGVLWTLAGTYRAVGNPELNFDLLAGARLLDLKQTLDYTMSVDIGPFAGPSRSGSSNVDLSYWDAVVGVKGRYAFGERREWFIPYYADVGTGQSDLTWQVFGGVGYTFSWGSLLAGWRYIDYKFKSDSKVQDLTFNGPMLGAAFSW